MPGPTSPSLPSVPLSTYFTVSDHVSVWSVPVTPVTEATALQIYIDFAVSVLAGNEDDHPLLLDGLGVCVNTNVLKL